MALQTCLGDLPSSTSTVAYETRCSHIFQPVHRQFHSKPHLNFSVHTLVSISWLGRTKKRVGRAVLHIPFATGRPQSALASIVYAARMFKADRAINPRWMHCSCGLSPFLKPRPSLQRARITPIILFLSFTASGALDFLQLRISPSLPLSPSGQMRSLQVVMPMRIEVCQSSASEIEARLMQSFVSSITAFLISTVSAASASASFETFENSLK